MLYFINSILSILSVILSLIICVFIFDGIRTKKLISVHFTWALLARHLSIILILVSILGINFRYIPINKFRYIVIFLTTVIIIIESLYLSKFSKIFNLMIKKIYIYISLINYLAALLVIAYFLNSRDDVISYSGYVENSFVYLFMMRHNSFKILAIIPILNIIIYSIFLIKNRKLVFSNVRNMFTAYLVKNIIFLYFIFGNISLNSEIIYTLYIASIDLFHLFFIKTEIKDKGIYYA